MSARAGSRFRPARGEPYEEHHFLEMRKFAAYIVARYGIVYMPVFERTERELDAFYQRRRPMDRVQAVLAASTINMTTLGEFQTRAGGTKAIA